MSVVWGYKFLLTLFITSAACDGPSPPEVGEEQPKELPKSRDLGSSLGSLNLETFLLMATEKEILIEMDKLIGWKGAVTDSATCWCTSGEN